MTSPVSPHDATTALSTTPLSAASMAVVGGSSTSMSVVVDAGSIHDHHSIPHSHQQLHQQHQDIITSQLDGTHIISSDRHEQTCHQPELIGSVALVSIDSQAPLQLTITQQSNTNVNSVINDSVQNLVENVLDNIVHNNEPQPILVLQETQIQQNSHSSPQHNMSESNSVSEPVHQIDSIVSSSTSFQSIETDAQNILQPDLQTNGSNVTNVTAIVKQEYVDDQSSNLDLNENDSLSEGGPRKSLRRRSKRTGHITEMQVDIDPKSIQHDESYQIPDGSSIVENDLDEDDLDGEDIQKSHGNKRSISADQDYVVNEEEGENDEEEELDDDDEDYDEYRPLKKRKIVRRKVRKVNNSALAKAKFAKNNEVIRLRKIIFKLRKHQLINKRYMDIVSQINTCLVDKMYNLINGESLTNVPLSRLLDALMQTAKSLEDDSFLSNFSSLINKYNEAFSDKKNMEDNIDQEEVDEREMEQSIGKLIKPKRKFSLLEMIGESPTQVKKIRNIRGRVGRPPKAVSAININNKNDANETSTNGAKKPRKKRRKQVSLDPSGESLAGDDDDKNTYHPCPWPNCTYESKREWALNDHINLTHTGLKQFGCKVEGCPSTFFGSAELDNHMKKCHAEVASKEFMPCTWPNCTALFKSKLGLRAHLQVHKGENLISCDWPGCNYLAKNKRQHENHIRKHTGDRPFSCDYPGCDSKFRTNDSLRHHKKSHSEYRPFKCDWPGCEANFKTNRGLTIHRALHTGEKLFKCDWPDCDYASERKYHVDLHIFERHTHVKPYQCTWSGCDASFLRNDKLQNHLKIHRQEKPFKCIHESCDKHFVEKGNMMKHYNNVHKR